MIKIAVSGCCGRMGRRIVSLAAEDKDFKIVGAIESKGHGSIGKDAGTEAGVNGLGVNITDNAALALRDAEVLIEFTTAEATILHLKDALSAKRGMVIGTTALSEEQVAYIDKAAESIPIVFSPNMSIGVNLLFSVVGDAARKLGGGYKVSIREAHHKHKKDAPSGTAKRLADIIAGSKGIDVKDIPIESIREGEIVGDHAVVFDNGQERIEVTHNAQTRDTFAGGALRAARFLAGKKPRLYTMRDVLEEGE